MKKLIIAISLIIFASATAMPQVNKIGIDTGHVSVDVGKLFYEITGKGDNIVLLHDGMVHREIWDEQFLVLAKNYRVTRYDRREFGKSTDPVGQYSHIEDLNQVFTLLNIDKAIVFGMSAGGGLAIDFTLKYPEKVTGLVLVGAVVGGYGYTNHMTNRGGNIKSFEMFSDLQKTIEYFVMDDPYEIYHENMKVKERVMGLMMSNLHQPKGGRAIPPDRPAAKFLSEIKVPTLVIVGEYDIPDVHAHAGVIHFGIPGAKREIILKSGHLVPMEQPEAFNIAVLTFIYNMEFNKILNSQGVDAAAKFFYTKRQNEPGIQFLREREMNELGYRFLQEEKTKQAITLFKINTVAFPNSANTYDSLGEAYLKDGQTDLAIENYKKSLELNPNNENAKEVLNKINASK
jgi:pimeloyl-ACP methyl ester carboxylesterase